MEFCAFLATLWAKAGLSAAAGVVVSFILEYWPGFADLAAKWKQLVYLGILVVVAGGAWLIAPLGDCVRPELWLVIKAVALAFTAGTAFHRLHAEAKKLFNGKKEN